MSYICTIAQGTSSNNGMTFDQNLNYVEYAHTKWVEQSPLEKAESVELLYRQICLNAVGVKKTYDNGCFLLINTGDQRIESKNGQLTYAFLGLSDPDWQSSVQAMQEDPSIKLTKLQVDGGASQNNYLIEFQAGLLGVDVIRPAISETTALGACMLADLVVGEFKDEAELFFKWKSAKRFLPDITKSKQIDILEQRERAIKAVLSFREH